MCSTHQLLDALEPLFPARDDEDQLSKGGVILDHHGCDLFPERWADLVVVMTCDHEILWERLEQRCVLRRARVPTLLGKARD